MQFLQRMSCKKLLSSEFFSSSETSKSTLTSLRVRSYLTMAFSTPTGRTLQLFLTCDSRLPSGLRGRCSCVLRAAILGLVGAAVTEIQVLHYPHLHRCADTSLRNENPTCSPLANNLDRERKTCDAFTPELNRRLAFLPIDQLRAQLQLLHLTLSFLGTIHHITLLRTDLCLFGGNVFPS